MAYTALFLCQFEISIFEIGKIVVFKNIFLFVSLFFFQSTHNWCLKWYFIFWYFEITTMNFVWFIIYVFFSWKADYLDGTLLCIKSREATPLGFFCLTEGHRIYPFSPTQLPRVLTDWYLVSRYCSKTILYLYLLQLWLLTAEQWNPFTNSVIYCVTMVNLTTRIKRFAHLKEIVWSE